MKNESEYIVCLCGDFNDGYKPLTRTEFWKLYHSYGDSIQGIIESGVGRVTELLKRLGAMAFSLDTINQMGIHIYTFLDEEFPTGMLVKLKDFCPPVLYICGDNSLLENKYAGYVGSRNITEADINWTKMMVEKNISDGFGIVSGGAKGVDSVSIITALNLGGNVIAYLPNNLKTFIKDKTYRKMISEGRLLACSHFSPLAPKTRNSFVSAAMERNKLIYVQSKATAVVRSDAEKGGTWAGATEALRHRWAPVFVWNNPEYEGNQRLIKMGGIPLSNEGRKETNGTEIRSSKDDVEFKQMTIWDIK